MPWLDDLVTKLIYEGEERSIWEYYKPCRYVGNGLDFTIPVGFQTDFASIPRKWYAPQLWYVFGDRFKKEAGGHDYLYRKNSIPLCHQVTADNYLEFALRESGKYSDAFIWEVKTAVSEAGGASFHIYRVEDILPHEMVD